MPTADDLATLHAVLAQLDADRIADAATQATTLAQLKAAQDQLTADRTTIAASSSTITALNARVAALEAQIVPQSPSAVYKTLAFYDDFNAPALDATKWRVRDNDFLGYDLAALLAGNVFTRDGNLVVASKREPCTVGTRSFAWSTGFVDTFGLFEQQYGRFSARIKVPTTAGDSAGLWPAWWMSRRSNSAAVTPDVVTNGQRGEIDIMECWGEPSTLRTDYRAGSGSFSLLSDTMGKDRRKRSGWWTPVGAPRLSDGFHDYDLEWSPTGFKLYLDGVLAPYGDQPYSALGFTSEVLNAPFYPRLNVQVGQPSYWGVPNAATKPYSEMLVDRVCIWH